MAHKTLLSWSPEYEGGNKKATLPLFMGSPKQEGIKVPA